MSGKDYHGGGWQLLQTARSTEDGDGNDEVDGDILPGCDQGTGYELVDQNNHENQIGISAELLDKVRRNIVDNNLNGVLDALLKIGNFDIPVSGEGDLEVTRRTGLVGLLPVDGGEQEEGLKTPGGCPSPLILATRVGSERVVNGLLNSHLVNVSKMDKYGRCALSYAVELMNIDLVRLLLCFTDDPGKKIQRNPPRNALMIAANLVTECIEIVMLLLTYPKQLTPQFINARNEHDECALTLAASRGHKQTVLTLLNHGADPNHGCLKYSDHCFVHAVESGQLQVAEMLLLYAPAEEHLQNMLNFSLIKCIEATDSKEMISFLLKSGANIENKKEDSLETPVLLAAKKCRRNILEYILLESDCDLEVADEKGCTPLHYIAKYSEDERCINLILERKDEFEVDAVDFAWKNTALHYALDRQEADKTLLDNIARELYMAGCSPFAANAGMLGSDGGITPLELAVKGDIVQFVHLVISRHRDAFNYIEAAEKLLFSAVENGSLGLIQCLLRADVPASTSTRNALYVALSRKKEDLAVVVQLLLEAGCEVNFEDGITGMTPLWKAIEGYDEDSVKASDVPYQQTIDLLVQYGADVNKMSSNYCETPVQFACKRDWYYLLRVFLSTGQADIRVGTHNTHIYTPIHLATKAESRECIKALIRYWPEVVNYEDAGMQAIDEYIEHNPASHWRSDIIELLLQSEIAVIKPSVAKKILKYGLEEKRHLVPVVVRAGAPVEFEVAPSVSPLKYAIKKAENSYLGLCKFLVQAGSNPAPLREEESEVFLRNVVANGGNEYQDIAKWLLKVTDTPRTLLELSRVSMRRQFSAKNLKATVKEFPLPGTLREFLLLRDPEMTLLSV